VPKSNSDLDLICIGRAAVDFYSQQVGSRLEDVASLAKYMGGSAANVAFGTARLGLRSAMLTRVGDEHMGRFVRETLSNEGVDTSQVLVDPERLTGLTILGIKDKDTFPLVFYRNDCADMALNASDISQTFIGSSKAILVQGTHMSTPKTRQASIKAVEFAKKAGVTTFLDIDYRPVLWGLTGLGEGENRFVASSDTTAAIQEVLPQIDYIVGTEEEIHIAGGSVDTIEALQNIRRISDGIIVLKLGAAGCTIIDGDVPSHISDFVVCRGKRVEVLNVLGAGDAFLTGFFYGWNRGDGHEQCALYANACGALVVSRHGCAPAFPSVEELRYFVENPEVTEIPDDTFTIRYMHRIAGRAKKQWNNLCILAFDHRSQFVEMAAKAGAPLARINQLKELLLEAALRTSAEMPADRSFGILADDVFAQDVLNKATGSHLWIGRPIEVPGSRPLELVGGRSVGTTLKAWPVEHVVKCLIYYDPDDAIELRNAQERQVEELYAACGESGHEFLLEIIPQKSATDWENSVVRSIRRFYNLRVYPDWWKLPGLSDQALRDISDLITERAPDCRGVLTLGLAESIDTLAISLASVSQYAICKGFAVGRTIFAEPSERWLRNELTDDGFIDVIAGRYQRLITSWIGVNNQPEAKV